MLKRIMIWFFVISISIAFGYFWCYQAKAYQRCLKTIQPAGWVCDEPKVIAGLDYHGIRFAESNADGGLSFIRDGQRCRLYTQAFEWDFYEGL